MPLYWLSYRTTTGFQSLSEPVASPVHARMRAALVELDEGTFTLDAWTERQDTEGDDWTPIVAGGSEKLIG
jgi:hypothetical protein